MVTETDKAYMAGIVDGEGTVYACKQRKANTNSVGYMLALAIVMCDEPTLKWIADTFGGRYHKSGRKALKATYRQPYQWVISNDKAVEVLKMLFPYLKTKKRQAALGFKFRELLKQTFKQTDAHRLALRDEMVREMSALNNPMRTVETVREVSVPQTDSDPVRAAQQCAEDKLVTVCR